MTRTLLVYDPTAPATVASPGGRKHLERLAGATVGFIDNAKPNFAFLVEDLAQLLSERHGVKAVVTRTKRGPSMPAADDVIEALARECDLVVTGSGD